MARDQRAPAKIHLRITMPPAPYTDERRCEKDCDGDQHASRTPLSFSTGMRPRDGRRISDYEPDQQSADVCGVVDAGAGKAVHEIVDNEAADPEPPATATQVHDRRNVAEVKHGQERPRHAEDRARCARRHNHGMKSDARDISGDTTHQIERQKPPRPKDALGERSETP